MVTLLLLFVLPAAGTQGDADSEYPSISADNRYVAFESVATNLVAGDTNGYSDIFVQDRQTGTTTRVSKSSAGVQGDYESYAAFISADGRYVVFESEATNLVAGDTNNHRDIFVRDRQTGTTWLVSKSSAGVQGDANSYDPSISSDGRYVVFHSYATNLVAGDTNTKPDVFVRDRQTGTTWLVSKSSAGVQGDGNSYIASISADGRYVAFVSEATTLVAGDTNAKADVFVRDRQTGTTTRVSRSSAGAEADDTSSYSSISEDGRYVAFSSRATSLVAGDTGGNQDVFVRDRQTGTTYLVSRSSAGVQGSADSYYPSLSADGRYVTFDTYASNLVSGDTNAKRDVFVRDRSAGTTYRMSRSSAGAEGDDESLWSSVSEDGRYVTFGSVATTLVSGDTNAKSDVFLRDRQTGTTTLVSKS
jgi:Tol biopolymer transport system component